MTQFRPKDTYRLKVRGWKNINHINRAKKKEAELAILTSDKREFKTKTITRDKEGHYIINGSIQQKFITIINMHSTQEHLNI